MATTWGRSLTYASDPSETPQRTFAAGWLESRSAPRKLESAPAVPPAEISPVAAILPARHPELTFGWRRVRHPAAHASGQVAPLLHRVGARDIGELFSLWLRLEAPIGGTAPATRFPRWRRAGRHLQVLVTERKTFADAPLVEIHGVPPALGKVSCAWRANGSSSKRYDQGLTNSAAAATSTHTSVTRL